MHRDYKAEFLAQAIQFLHKRASQRSVTALDRDPRPGLRSHNPPEGWSLHVGKPSFDPYELVSNSSPTIG